MNNEERGTLPFFCDYLPLLLFNFYLYTFFCLKKLDICITRLKKCVVMNVIRLKKCVECWFIRWKKCNFVVGK